LEPIIHCENLVKIFKIADLEVLALQGLDLTVQRGELMGIVGASGSGKSTLMNVLGGLVRPSAGQVLVDGHDLLKLSNTALNRYRREEVGFVWQQGSRNIIPYLNAQENVELPMILAGVGGRKVRQRAGELLDLVGLAERKDYYIGQLSGGEQQRVAIAVALANNPSILLADEPTGELDSETALTIFRAFQSLNQELGVTILIVSHDPDIARHVHRVMAIRDGKTASETRRKPREKPEHSSENGHPEEMDHSEHHEEHFEELVLLDSAGRLQVPKAYREALNIQGRVRMEMVDGGVIIRPVEAHEPELQARNAVRETVQAPRGVRGWLDKLKRNS
jgi:putative ABC transport system ATP-binding protein